MNETRTLYVVCDEFGSRQAAFENEADAIIYTFELTLNSIMDDPTETSLKEIKDTWESVKQNGGTDWGPFIEETRISAGWRDVIRG